jgi:hypothetical protein
MIRGVRGRAALVAAAGVVVLVALPAAGWWTGTHWLAAQRLQPHRGIDRYYGAFGVAVLHDGCSPPLAGWHLSWGQPVRLRDCG